MCASMCPCFHHFLLFSAKKWDCTSGDFYSFSHFVIHDGILPGLSRARRKRHRRHGGFGKASRNLAACKRVHGLPCLRIAKLCYFSGSPATAEQGEGYRRFVCKLQKALHPFEKWLLFIARLQTLSQKRQNSTFCKTWGRGSSPFLPQNSHPALFDMRSYWYSYFCRTMTFYVADHFTVNVYCILVCSCVWRLPKEVFLYGYLDPLGEGMCLCVCMYMGKLLCVLPSSWHPGCYSAVIYLWTPRRSLL